MVSSIGFRGDRYGNDGFKIGNMVPNMVLIVPNFYGKKSFLRKL